MGRLSRTKWCLLGCLIILLVFAVATVFVPDSLTGAVTWLANKNSAIEARESLRTGETLPDNLIEMTVENIVLSQLTSRPAVILKQKDGEIYLPIVIGITEATAITVSLENVQLPRPLTPDLLCDVIYRMGSSVDYVVIRDIKDEIFYANILLENDWRQQEIDARPSDAIALAVRFGAPIYVSEQVLEEAKTKALDDQQEPEDEQDEEVDKRFREIMDGLELDDAG